MQIITDDGFVGEEPVNVGTMLRYRDGSMSVIPHGFFACGAAASPTSEPSTSARTWS